MTNTKKTFNLNWKEIGATAIVTGLSIAGVAFALQLSAGEPVPATEPTTPLCTTEDDTDCFWSATVQGNGFGESFYADAEGNVYYLPVAVTETPEYQSVAECAKQLTGFARDSMALSIDLAGQWAESDMRVFDGETSTFGEYVITDNLQPMQNRYDHIMNGVCK